MLRHTEGAIGSILPLIPWRQSNPDFHATSMTRLRDLGLLDTSLLSAQFLDSLPNLKDVIGQVYIGKLLLFSSAYQVRSSIFEPLSSSSPFRFSSFSLSPLHYSYLTPTSHYWVTPLEWFRGRRSHLLTLPV